MIKFHNTYTSLPAIFYEKVLPAKFRDPKLICFNHQLAKELGIKTENITEAELALIFSGQKILAGSEPIAMAYAGFQFGHPVPQLGDGRAHLLGEVNGFDIQLKGSGQSRFSRRGDGRSSLGPVLREYIVSEAMHALGVPTTRALCAVRTGEEVQRQYGLEPGGIFTRVANSHLRVGTFQYFAFKQDLNSIQLLLDYTLKRHYPEIDPQSDNQTKVLEFLKELIAKQAKLISLWSGLGFIHGVMNTDNFSVAGITIDYGPCAFMDEFEFNKVFSSIDQNGRYAYSNQIPIAKWNILRLADCLLPLISSDQATAVNILESNLYDHFSLFDTQKTNLFSLKLGLNTPNEELVLLFLEYLEENAIDFTLAFYHLPNLFTGDNSFYPNSPKREIFLKKWISHNPDLKLLKSINPAVIPRNHQIENVIKDAFDGNFKTFHQMLTAVINPFQKNEVYMHSPKPSERVYHTFCGT